MNTAMEKLRSEITALKRERKAIILAHNYQRPEVQDIADYTGDSFELSRIAAQTDAKVIVFCGVQFMAESAAILSPDKTVLLPVKEAGCPLADMATSEQLQKLREEYPDAKVVSYVNTSAAVKAESDICCTSANAVKVVNSLQDTHRIIFVPDRNLGRYAARFTDKEIILWKGWCPTHIALYASDVKRCREQHQDAEFMAHPECLPEVLQLADKVASTSGMLTYANQSSAREFIVGTEMGLIHRLQKENPDKKFYPPTDYLTCPTMKLTTLEQVHKALHDMEHIITIEEQTRRLARKALDAMLGVI